MSKKMLVDATHSEETRVAVVSGNVLEDYDFESIIRKSLKGNIYLAKVTRVEPSLQAAFVNFGGNRHGFLPFSEIHPDYYKIPVADREALMAEQEEIARKMAEKEAEELSDDTAFDDQSDEAVESKEGQEEEKPKKKTTRGRRKKKEEIVEEPQPEEEVSEETKEEAEEKPKKKTTRKKPAAKKKTTKKSEALEIEGDEIVADEPAEVDGGSNDGDADGNVKDKDKTPDADGNKGGDGKRRGGPRGRRGRRGGARGRRGNNRGGRRQVKDIGGEDYQDSPQDYLWKKIRKSYKIQEVIKRGQIMLVQVQKEERGNKGAAVTSYISLPGRYSVLMPNSPRGGGISRKIPFKERKEMRGILNDMEIPKGMSVIIRTAGIGRSKPDIKRDLDYLYRLWDTIRDLTLKSTAPALVYEEGNLVKRSIRDIYTRGVEEVLVAGEEGYKTAKDFMKMMIPSHAKKIKKYDEDDDLPLFHRYQVEGQIDEIHNNQVQLPSGGYLVINPTEALVSIDVNSGRSTKERHIEETALKTNIESAEEVARQLRLRDLGGLVVIDFIDMEDYRNNRTVERKLADALSKDRARVQMGRISNFGLMELSRQRLRPSLTETHFKVCSHCGGAGYVPTTDAAALRVIRAIEEEGIKHRTAEMAVTAQADVGLYILNNKRKKLAEIEERYDFKVHIELSYSMGPAEHEIDRTKSSSQRDATNDSEDENVAKLSKAADEVIEELQEATKAEEESAQEEKSKPKRRSSRSNSRSRGKKVTEETEDKKEPVSETPEAESETEVKVEAPKDAEEPVAPVVEEEVQKPVANDDQEALEQERVADYEVVNQKPDKKKKGWWQKLVE